MEEEKILNFQFGEIEMSDEKDIKFFRNYLKDLTIINTMLGEYDKDGKYDIEEVLKKDLTSAEKNVSESKDTEIICSANVSEFVLNFKITLTKHDEREKTATLFLIESMKSFTGDFDRKEITEIASYTDFDDIYFEGKIKKLFHLHYGDAEAKDYDKEQNARLVYNKKLLQKQLNKILYLSGEEPAKSYLHNMLILLEKSGPQGEYLLKRYKKLLLETQGKLVKGSAGYYYRLKSMLDEIMFSSNIKFEAETKSKIEILRENFYNAEIAFRKAPVTPKPANKKKEIVVVQQSKKKSVSKAEKSSKKPSQSQKPATPTKISKLSNDQKVDRVIFSKNDLEGFLQSEITSYFTTFSHTKPESKDEKEVVEEVAPNTDLREFDVANINIKKVHEGETKPHAPEMML